MNRAVELHDSVLADIEAVGGDVTLRRAPAYIHASEGRPGVDPGSGWHQAVTLVLRVAVVESAPSRWPCSLSHGTLSAGGAIHENCIPLPLACSGAASLSAVTEAGVSLRVRGSSVEVVPRGEATFVELFPGPSDFRLLTSCPGDPGPPRILLRPRGEPLMTPVAGPSDSSTAVELRTLATTWAVAAGLPLPVLVATNPAASAGVACLYLGLASAWLVAEFHRRCGLPESPRAWRVRAGSTGLALAANVALFVAFGLAAGVQTRFPFPLMAMLSAVPAAGALPWLLRRVRDPYAAIILGSALILAAKLAACVVARVAYGPDYIEQGYVAADWRTAKLMISLFWSFSTALSLGLLLADARACRRLEASGRLTLDRPFPA